MLLRFSHAPSFSRPLLGQLYIRIFLHDAYERKRDTGSPEADNLYNNLMRPAGYEVLSFDVVLTPYGITDETRVCEGKREKKREPERETIHTGRIRHAYKFLPCTK